MRLLADMMGAFLAGLLGHLFMRDPFQRDFVNGWLPLVSYTSGVLLTLPFVLLIYHHTGKRTLQHIIASYLLAFLGVGSGVAVGYYIVPD